MKLVASIMVAEVEPGRYLVPCVSALLEFCDEVVLLLDGDGQWAKELGTPWGEDGKRVTGVIETAGIDFFAHEGRARQRLFDVTLSREPTHILAIDADEFVGDGRYLREAVEQYPDTGVWMMALDEVWKAEPECLCVRVDGAWGNRSVPSLYATPPGAERWRIADRKLACGREPQEVVQAARHGGRLDTSILHFGWAREADRIDRHARYQEHDQGNYHAKRHLDSILWPDERVLCESFDWPNGLAPYRSELLLRSAST